ncbi:phosphotransferase family protein [Streptomyces sp. NPDC102360]|uniref:phosphotransferase family protein n=1 Tax=Streptomyces sp. NPDC102360 TaxID=3366160 RepID=UPI003828CF54
MTESPLPGGSINAVVRIGDTVHRPASSEFTRDLLRWFEVRGWSGAPPYHGSDDEGRDVLGFLEGHVAWEARQPASVSSDGSLVALARLTREFHDLTAGTELAGAEEVVCHNDLSPKNTVYRPVDGALRPVAFIDWDLAAPGMRVHDVAHVCWQYLGLGPSTTDVDDAARRMRLIADTYGLDERRGLVAAVLWWQDRCWRGIQAGADRGDAAMARLRDSGAVDDVRGAYEWVRGHRAVLERALD